ncbi:hypothetical protein wTkk_000054 [Wolbachia endosymbiont of Trichogramma kaykai]
MLIIGCVLTMRQGLIKANIAMPMQNCLDSKQIAFQKNISNIKQKTDISFQFFCKLILTCQINLCLAHINCTNLLILKYGDTETYTC